MKTGYLIAMFAILAVFLVAGCTSGNVVYLEQKTKEPIEIGVFTVLSGDAAVYGNAIKNGLDLAAGEINNEGGVLGREVKLVYEDTHLDSKAAVSTMNKFVNVNGYPIVIAAEGSGATLAAAPLADETRTVYMVPIASTPELKTAGDYVFRVVPSDSAQAEVMVKIAEERQYETAGVLYVNDAYGVGIRDAFKEGFGNVVAEETFTSGDKDFRTQLTKIKAKNPEVLVIVARAEFPAILKQAKELGIESQIIASETLREESLIESAGEAAEGVLVPFFAEPTDYVGYKEKYKEKYGEEPAIYSEYGYDSLMALEQAIEEAGTTNSEEVKEALYDVEYYGASGIVKFDQYGEVTEKPFVVYEVVNGELEETKVIS